MTLQRGTYIFEKRIFDRKTVAVFPRRFSIAENRPRNLARCGGFALDPRVIVVRTASVQRREVRERHRHQWNGNLGDLSGEPRVG